MRGRAQVVFVAVLEGKAQMIRAGLRWSAYIGLNAAVKSARGLKAQGMDVVTKGNERLYPGAAIRTAGAKQ